MTAVSLGRAADPRMSPTLSIVIPVFNEEQRLPALFDALATELDAICAAAGVELVEVLTVDDGSSDRTPELLAAFTGLPGRCRTIRLPDNRGKGAAVREGALASRSDLCLVTDVDLSTPLDELATLMAALPRGADVVIGSRALENSRVLVHQPAYRERMGKTFNKMLRVLTGIPWRDTQCGFKLFRLETARRLFELQRVERFAFDAELLVNARRLGLDVEEVPVSWTDNPDTRVGLLTSSAQMALDAVRIAYRSRRPLEPR